MMYSIVTAVVIAAEACGVTEIDLLLVLKITGTPVGGPLICCCNKGYCMDQWIIYSVSTTIIVTVLLSAHNESDVTA